MTFFLPVHRARATALPAAAALFFFSALAAASEADRVEPLAAVLAKAGASEERKSSASCAFTEETVLEQLSSDGKTEGKVIRRHETTVREAILAERKLVSRAVEGEPSSLLQKEYPPKRDRQYSAFHPSQQPFYEFELDGPADGPQARVRFRPLERTAKRMQGTAVIDLRSGLVVRIEGSPSDRAPMLEELQLTLFQEETACGPQLTRVSTEGKGGFLFFTLRFRSETVLSGHHAI